MKTGWTRCWLRWLILALVLSVSRGTLAGSAAEPVWRVGPVPVWVVDSKAAEATPGLAPKDSSDGQRYLLYAHEIRVAESTHSYLHTTRLITNEAGLQATSQLNVEIDPSYQTLTLHYVRVKRGKALIDELDPQAVKLVQREANLENQVYDSRQSAVLFLPDLRIGDVVDLAYTLSGSDPTLEGVYDGQLLLGAPVPIDRLLARISSPKPLHLSVAIRGPSQLTRAQLGPRVNAAQTDYRWDLHDTPAYVV